MKYVFLDLFLLFPYLWQFLNFFNFINVSKVLIHVFYHNCDKIMIKMIITWNKYHEMFKI